MTYDPIETMNAYRVLLKDTSVAAAAALKALNDAPDVDAVNKIIRPWRLRVRNFGTSDRPVKLNSLGRAFLGVRR